MKRSASIALTLLAAGCASVPRDAGFSEVRRTVMEETRQPVEWDPHRPVSAEPAPGLAEALREELTVERAVQIAYAHNRDVQATLEGLGVARAELIKASTIRNPIFEGEVRFPDESKNPVEIHVTKTLLDLFQLKNRKRMGRAQFEAARAEVSAALVNFAAEVRADWYGLVAARRLLAREQTLLQAREAATELGLRQHDAGNISDLDLEGEQSRYEQARLAHARAQLAEVEARERLTAALGSAERVELKLPADFPPLPEGEASLEEAERQVVARRLDLAMARSEIEAALRARSLAGGAVLDELAVGIHLEREPDGTRTAGPDLTVPVPVFDRGKAQKEGARALLRQAQQRYAGLVVSARAEARLAHERLREARARLTYLREVVRPRRERILKLTQLEYNAMLKGAFPLLEAREGLAAAEQEEIRATRDYWIARTELETAILGVSRFSVRPEAAASRLDRGERPSQQPSKSNEH